MHSFNIHNSVRTESKFLMTNSNKAFAKLVWGREVERCSLPKPQVENIKGLVDSLVAKKGGLISVNFARRKTIVSEWTLLQLYCPFPKYV